MFLQNAHPYTLIAIAVIIGLFLAFKVYEWIRSHSAKSVFRVFALIWCAGFMIWSLIAAVLWVFK